MPSALKQRAVEVSDMEAGKLVADKADGFARIWPIFTERDLYSALLSQVGLLLDEIEKEMGSVDHMCPWICGPTYTAADVALSCLLFRIQQIGMDDDFWKGGTRPSIAVYAEMAFKRPSFEKATEWSKHKHEVAAITRTGADASVLNAAYWGMGAAAVMAGVYAVRKMMKK